MSIKHFNKAFGLQADLDEEKRRFVQRINQTILKGIQEGPYPDDYERVFRRVCYGLGENAGDLISNANQYSYSVSLAIPGLRALTGDDFTATLKVLVLLHGALHPQNVVRLNQSIELALASAATDLGIRWKSGLFYPSGAKELDEKLINDNLDFLQTWPDVRAQFSTALTHFRSSLQNVAGRKDAITNAYSAVEGLARATLSNDKSFDNNSNALVDFTGLPSEYKNIVHYYKQIAHRYSSRHAGEEFSHSETEAFIYLTGLLMRLILEKATPAKADS